MNTDILFFTFKKYPITLSRYFFIKIFQFFNFIISNSKHKKLYVHLFYFFNSFFISSIIFLTFIFFINLIFIFHIII